MYLTRGLELRYPLPLLRNDDMGSEVLMDPSERPIESRLSPQSKKQISSVAIDSFCSRDDIAQDEVSTLSSCEGEVALGGEVTSGGPTVLSPPNTATKMELSGCHLRSRGEHL